MNCPSCGVDAGEISRYCPSCGSTIVRPNEQDEYIGQIINQKYRVEQLIGEGGMGKVYRAKQTALDSLVVLKVLRASLLSDERTVARFQREAKAASRLNHPNSIKILDFDQDKRTGALYIAMEFVSGRDLHQILSKEWPLPEARVIKIVSQVLSALADAHGAGVIHRDLKPENIMVENRRGEDFVKVLDFGIAKIQDSAGEEGPALTRAGFVCGTPEYMSPEQARGASLDHRSDLYAVGVIIYQLMTGLLPFESDSAVGFATKHLTAEPPAPSRRRPDAKISQLMERLILRALAKDPNDRPQTADQFRQDLFNILESKSGNFRAHSQPRRPSGSSSNVLQPLPRKVTPSEQADTRVEDTNTESPWGTAEKTVRTMPNSASGALTDVADKDTAPRPAISTKTGKDTPAQGGGGMLVFKLLTLVLVAISIGLGWYYFTQTQQPQPVIEQPKDVPVPGQFAVEDKSKNDQPQNLYDMPAPDRPAKDAAQDLVVKGDEYREKGDEKKALISYQDAWIKDSRPDLSLRIGEMNYRQNRPNQAKAWWKRHLADAPESNARGYILGIYPELDGRTAAMQGGAP